MLVGGHLFGDTVEEVSHWRLVLLRYARLVRPYWHLVFVRNMGEEKKY